MTKKLPFKQNSAGIWIDTNTGRFAKKSDYLPYLERKLSVNKAKSVATKEYWNDVKSVKNLFGITDTKEARKKLHDSPKYVTKRGKKFKQFSSFWDKMKGQSKEKVKLEFTKLESEDYELVSF